MTWYTLISKESVHTKCRQGGDIPQVAFRTCLLRLGGNVDLLKLDCEGAEWSILADSESLAAVRSLVMEYDLVDGHTEAELVSIVRKLGFRVLKRTLTGPTWTR